MSVPAAVPGAPALDKYELLEEIGSGGMATVYRARDPRLGRDVAVKVIHKHLRENKEVATRFVAEARAAAKLRHPGIVEVYDVSSEEDGERYLVVELLRGCTLRKILHEHREMPAEIGASIVLALCDALEHAHAGGIIHRDVKPENVLVELPSDRRLACAPGFGAEGAVRRPGAPIVEPDLDWRAANDASPPGVHVGRDTAFAGPSVDAAPDAGGDASAAAGAEARRASAPKRSRGGSDLGVIIKLTDFGIAKILDAQGVTSTGQVLGSPAHMAPEQIEGGEVDARTDVFALGVLMYECLVGHLPFEGKNPAQVLRRVLDGSYPAADRERPSVGGRWAKIVAGALAHDAADRLASPAALAELIRAELSALGVPDARAEIAAYFEDPEGYAAEHAKRLVPRLCSRAEAEKKRGDVPGAAADYNRALALAPDDLAILKRITTLNASAGRRQLARRAAAVALGSVALGVAAFGVTRALRTDVAPVATAEPAPSEGPVAPPDQQTAPEDADDGDPEPSPSASASARPRPKIRISSATPQVVTAPPAAPQPPRRVQFLIVPAGAKLVLDGAETAWFGQPLQLAPGPHKVSVSVPNSKCCKAYNGSVLVQSIEEHPEDPQKLGVTLEILPATVTVVDGPDNGQYSCPGVALNGFVGGGAKTVRLPDLTWQGPCQFTPLTEGAKPKTSTVTLRAGESTTISWPN